ncbi:MAG: phosphatase PAP2 family protein [Anaerolineales bacterium]
MQRKVSQADRFAELVSYIFHPLLIVIPTLVIAMVRLGSTLWEAVFWTALSIAIVNLPMALLLFWGVRSGKYSDASVSIREQRTSIYAVGGTCLVVLLAVLIVGKAPAVITACLVSAVLATMIGYLVNRYTKLSLHSAAMAGCATVLVVTAPVIGIVMALFAPLVGWARIRLKHHTPLQILIGWVIPVGCVLIVFWLMNI